MASATTFGVNGYGPTIFDDDDGPAPLEPLLVTDTGVGGGAIRPGDGLPPAEAPFETSMGEGGADTGCSSFVCRVLKELKTLLKVWTANCKCIINKTAT